MDEGERQPYGPQTMKRAGPQLGVGFVGRAAGNDARSSCPVDGVGNSTFCGYLGEFRALVMGVGRNGRRRGGRGWTSVHTTPMPIQLSHHAAWSTFGKYAAVSNYSRRRRTTRHFSPVARSHIPTMYQLLWEHHTVHTDKMVFR